MRTSVHESYLRETPAPPPMTCSLSALGVDDEGAVAPIATLRIEEFLSTIAYPLLGYLFFEPGSSSLPERFTLLSSAGVAGFHSRDMQGSGTLDVYHTMLNIIGERMRKYPAARLSLTGCNMDQAEEKGNLDLSRARAEGVRSYLADVWGIDRSRIDVMATNLPEKHSNPLTADGQAENRRVEISSNMPEILDVLVIDDTTRTSTPPVVRLAPVVVAPSGVASWEVTVTQHGNVLKRFAGTGAPPENLEWDLANDQPHMPRFNEPLAIRLEASSPTGEHVACAMELPTQVTTISQKRENRVGDYTIDRFNLILFSVGEATITPANQRIIDLVKSRLKPRSEVTVEGFADRTGNPASNQRLSAQRAKATAAALGRPDATVRGIGESRLLFDNDIPEGRYYCRTVQITVKTPIGR
jgi:outer membrane protein OmpA-like peptidoglycan-associated protein